MVRFAATPRLLGAFAAAFVLAVLACLLPELAYQRWHQLDGTDQARLGVAYDRIAYNDAPIDVAIFGPSRIGAAVDATRLAAGLAAAGHPLTVTNFAVPEEGRDTHWLLLRELLARKRPKLVVITVIEQPTRFGHPAYKVMAPVRDVLDPAYFPNFSWPRNLMYLPFRQMKLFAARLFPAALARPATWDPARRVADPTFFRGPEPRTDVGWLRMRANTFRAMSRPRLFGPDFADREYGSERTYTARMAREARAAGARVVFLYMPYYTGPAMVQERAHYAALGPLIDAGWIAAQDEYYWNVGHLNARGSAAFTDWLAPRLVAQLAPAAPRR